MRDAGDIGTLASSLGARRSALRAELEEVETRLVTLARKLHQDGSSVVGIAQACGVHRVTVHRWLREQSVGLAD